MSEAGSLPGKYKDGPPTWNGAAEIFQAYEESARLFEQTTPSEEALCGPKLQAALEGSALRLVVGKMADWLSDNGGVERLLSHLRQSLGKPQMPELTDLLGRYFRSTKRRRAESMNSYITCKTEVYVRCQQALRNHFPESEVQKRDAQRRRREDEGEAANNAFQAEEELTEEEYAAWTEAEEECQQALAAVEQARRTLKVARDDRRWSS